MLNKILKLGVMSAALAAAFSSYASDGTVTVTGSVSATTCSVVGNGSSGVGSFTVALPKVGIGSLNAAGKTAGATAFTIGVSGCTGGTATTVTPYIEPGTNVNANGRLSTSLANVDVQLQTLSGTAINMGAVSGSQNIAAATISGGAASSTLVAQYYATGAVAAGGSFTTSFTYSLVYN